MVDSFRVWALFWVAVQELPLSFRYEETKNLIQYIPRLQWQLNSNSVAATQASGAQMMRKLLQPAKNMQAPPETTMVVAIGTKRDS